jgi:hypothetical protein
MQTAIERAFEALVEAIAERVVSRLGAIGTPSPLRISARSSAPATSSSRVSPAERERLKTFTTALAQSKLSRANAALVTDAFELYRAWCSKKKSPSTCAMRDFARYLREVSLPVRRKRYILQDGALRGPHTIVVLRSLSTSDPNDREALGRELELFRHKLRKGNKR